MRNQTLENELSPAKAMAWPKQKRRVASRRHPLTLQQSLDNCWAIFGENCALEVEDSRFTYADLGRCETPGATALKNAGGEGPFVVILGYRSAAAFLCAELAALFREFLECNGHRVELSEIESVLRKSAECDFAIAMSWPYAPQTGRADSVVAVIAAETLCEKRQTEIQRQCRASLPAYAVPSRIVCLPAFPFNANGKTDRKAIANILAGILP